MSANIRELNEFLRDLGNVDNIWEEIICNNLDVYDLVKENEALKAHRHSRADYILHAENTAHIKHINIEIKKHSCG